MKELLNGIPGEVLTTAVSLGGALLLAQWRLKKAEDDNDKQWEFITEIREWQTRHVEDALNKRIDYEKRFGEIVNTIGKVEIQYIEAEKRTRQIEMKIDQLSSKIDRLVESMAKK